MPLSTVFLPLAIWTTTTMDYAAAAAAAAGLVHTAGTTAGYYQTLDLSTRPTQLPTGKNT